MSKKAFKKTMLSHHVEILNVHTKLDEAGEKHTKYDLQVPVFYIV